LQVGGESGNPACASRSDPATACARLDQINETIGAVNSVVGNGRNTVTSADNDNGPNTATPSTDRKTPVRDAVEKAGSDITKVVTEVGDNVKKALSDDSDDDNGDGGDGGAAVGLPSRDSPGAEWLRGCYQLAESARSAISASTGPSSSAYSVVTWLPSRTPACCRR
jgi:hypothetical protein